MKNTTPSRADLLAWGILLILALVWGSSYILIKKSLVAFSNTQVAYLRIGITGAAFFPFLIYHFRRIDWSSWPYLLLVGLTGTAIPAFLFATAQQDISSSLAGILSSLTPLLTVVVATVVYSQRIDRQRVIGIATGLVGAVVLFASQGLTWDAELLACGMIVLACLCYATSSNTVGAKLKHMNAMTISAASFSMVGIPAAIILFTTNFQSVLVEHPHGWQSFYAVVFLALMGTVLMSLLFFYLVQMRDAVFASVVSYLIPIVAIGWGVWDGEQVTLWQFGGMALILGGVYLSRKRRSLR